MDWKSTLIVLGSTAQEVGSGQLPGCIQHFPMPLSAGHISVHYEADNKLNK